MKINNAGLDLIKKYEGCVLHAYPDPATKAEPYTIGYGATYYEDGSKVMMGDIITKEKAESLLIAHVGTFVDKVMKLIKSTINENQKSALVSFSYNCGIGNLSKSTLLKKVNVNPNDTTIRDEFMKWNKAAGKVMAGLTTRRKAEADLYFTAV